MFGVALVVDSAALRVANLLRRPLSPGVVCAGRRNLGMLSVGIGLPKSADRVWTFASFASWIPNVMHPPHAPELGSLANDTFSGQATICRIAFVMHDRSVCPTGNHPHEAIRTFIKNPMIEIALIGKRVAFIAKQSPIAAHELPTRMHGTNRNACQYKPCCPLEEMKCDNSPPTN